MEHHPLPVARLKKRIRSSSRAHEDKTAMPEQHVSDIESLVAKQIGQTARGRLLISVTAEEPLSPTFRKKGATYQNIFNSNDTRDASPGKPAGVGEVAEIKHIVKKPWRRAYSFVDVTYSLAENNCADSLLKVAEAQARKGLAERKKNYLKKTVSTDELLAALSDLCE